MLIAETLLLHIDFCKLPFLFNLLVFNENDIQAWLILEKVIDMIPAAKTISFWHSVGKCSLGSLFLGELLAVPIHFVIPIEIYNPPCRTL